jgi:hypothetical protein
MEHDVSLRSLLEALSFSSYRVLTERELRERVLPHIVCYRPMSFLGCGLQSGDGGPGNDRAALIRYVTRDVGCVHLPICGSVQKQKAWQKQNRQSADLRRTGSMEYSESHLFTPRYLTKLPDRSLLRCNERKAKWVAGVGTGLGLHFLGVKSAWKANLSHPSSLGEGYIRRNEAAVRRL